MGIRVIIAGSGITLFAVGVLVLNFSPDFVPVTEQILKSIAYFLEAIFCVLFAILLKVVDK